MKRILIIVLFFTLFLSADENPLHRSLNTPSEIIKTLERIKDNTDVFRMWLTGTTNDAFGDTPAHKAIRYNFLHALQILLSYMPHGMIRTMKDTKGRTLIQFATIKGNNDAINIIKKALQTPPPVPSRSLKPEHLYETPQSQPVYETPQPLYEEPLMGAHDEGSDHIYEDIEPVYETIKEEDTYSSLTGNYRKHSG